VGVDITEDVEEGRLPGQAAAGSAAGLGDPQRRAGRIAIANRLLITDLGVRAA
jgi:hypothetical protein